MSPLSWKGQNLCGLSLVFIKDWRVVFDDYLRGDALAYLSCPASGSSPTASLDSTPFERVVATITKTSPSNDSLLRDVMEKSHRFIFSCVEGFNT